MKIEDAKGMQLAQRNLRILRAELAGFGPPKDQIDKAMRASIEGQIISIEKDMKDYEYWWKLMIMNQFNPENDKNTGISNEI